MYSNYQTSDGHWNQVVDSFKKHDWGKVLLAISIIFISMEITLKLLGGRLREMRKALGMLQEDVAKHLDVNKMPYQGLKTDQEEVFPYYLNY